MKFLVYVMLGRWLPFWVVFVNRKCRHFVLFFLQRNKMAEKLETPTPSETETPEMTDKSNKKPQRKKYVQNRMNILSSRSDWERIKEHWMDVELFQQNKKPRPDRNQDQGLNTLCKRLESNCIFLRKKVIMAERLSVPAFTSPRLNQHFSDHLLETHEKYCDVCYFEPSFEYAYPNNTELTTVKSECFDNHVDETETETVEKPSYTILPLTNHTVKSAKNKSVFKTNSIYCTYCHKNFASSYHLIDHVTKLHPTPMVIFGCPFPSCEVSYTTKKDLNLHFQSHNASIIQIKGVVNPCAVQTATTTVSLNKPLLTTTTPAAPTAETILPDVNETDNICSLCSKEFESESLLLQHLNMHTLKIKFCCHLCNECFFEKKKLFSHFTTHRQKHIYALKKHEKDPVVLSLETEAESDDLLSKNYPGFQCILCQKLCFERTDYHLKNYHQGVQYYVFKCHICEMYFGSLDEIINHFGRYCRIPNYNIGGEKIKRQTNSYPFQCHLCPSKFTSIEVLDKHVRKCGKPVSFPCTSCDKKYGTKQALDNHVEYNHIDSEKKLYSCNTCQLKFSQLKFLKKHERRHLAKKHKCEECGKGPFDRRILKQHMKMHEKPCSCGDCPKCNEIKEIFACQICKKMYKSPYMLKKHHKIIHEGIINLKFTCTICDKKFRESGTLKRHIKTHENICNCGTCDFCKTRDPRTQCEVCLKLFATMHHLNRHKVVHTGERNFVCEICGKGFNQAGNLKVHVKSHLRRMGKEK